MMSVSRCGSQRVATKGVGGHRGLHHRPHIRVVVRRLAGRCAEADRAAQRFDQALVIEAGSEPERHAHKAGLDRLDVRTRWPASWPAISSKSSARGRLRR
jgi:hypothetical protein